MKHLTVVFGEHNDGSCNICDTCGHKTALITASPCWDVDSEPFADGETDETLDRIVEVSEELSAHYCLKCRKITSLSFNGE